MGQLSPDGHWRWDGWRWVPAYPVIGQLSPDEQWRWDGWRWVPGRPLAVPQRRPARAPTIWTRRLQILLLVVAGVGVLPVLVGAALLPSEMDALRAQLVAQWQAQGIPPSELSTLEQSFSTVVFFATAVVVLGALGVCALQVVGTLRRWVWWYWVQFAFCCFGALGLLLIPIDLASPMYRSLPTLPLALLSDLLNTGAGICMLIAAVRIGPWAMTRDPHRFGAGQD